MCNGICWVLWCEFGVTHGDLNRGMACKFLDRQDRNAPLDEPGTESVPHHVDQELLIMIHAQMATHPAPTIFAGVLGQVREHRVAGFKPPG